MAQSVYPEDSERARVIEEVQDAPSTDESTFITLNKNLELRIKTDQALRSSIEALVIEIRELKDIIRLAHNI